MDRAEATPTVLLSTAKLLFLAKDYEGSMEFTKRAEAGGARDNDVFRMTGYSAVELGNPQLGLDNLDKMVKSGVKPYYLDNVYFGRAYQALKQDSLAIGYYEKAAPLDTLNNHFATIYSILYGQKKYAAAVDAAMKSMDWKANKKQPITSTDWYNPAMAQYFVTAYTPREDTLGRYNNGLKADSMYAKAIAINDKFAPFHLYRARTNSYIDYTGTKWLAVPHYEKFLAVVDMAKANKDQLYESYKYLAGYHLTITKDKVKAQEYVDKATAIKPEDPDGLKVMLNPALAVPATPVVVPKTSAPKAPKK